MFTMCTLYVPGKTTSVRVFCPTVFATHGVIFLRKAFLFHHSCMYRSDWFEEHMGIDCVQCELRFYISWIGVCYNSCLTVCRSC